jgi:hypothetical protein
MSDVWQIATKLENLLLFFKGGAWHAGLIADPGQIFLQNGAVVQLWRRCSCSLWPGAVVQLWRNSICG